jgi:hypothetical protein
MEHNCRIADKLQQVHKWAHLIKDAHDDEDLKRVHQLGEKLLGMLNDEEECNGVKFLALLEVISIGADQLEYEMAMESDASTTIH